ncbi:Pimeloyl-ACP methyl ester carboxylesterase [Micromonospora pallida]|uniref:Pimeloyl-ACP methyl ester carboxylesterase n=1 Tax=Micromonospora pallida TaxID=145854 RepID=A0A1C6RJ38_9ACTN|nr:alpha/beta hydrolase [Micromonospora pallida]SCL17184.1 Pimeloyl-ACP methyl ester carboxylesterase [Micromonospora pallida]
MPEVTLSAGTIDYDDTGGTGPVVVLLHGVAMDASLWRNVVPALAADYRCITPTLPLGGHRRPMHPDADLSMHGMVKLVAEFLDALDLRDVALVANDWGGPQVLIADGLADRVGRLVLSSCEAYDNYPPGEPGKSLFQMSKVPGGLMVAATALRFRLLQRLPTTFGLMAKRPVPRDVMRRWSQPMQTDPAIRRDLRKYVLSVPDKAELADIAKRAVAFEGPTLIVWATEDKVMPVEHGRRLAREFPNAELVEIDDSYALIPEDQPAALADALREFLRRTDDADGRGQAPQ